ncbi:unnamed protein product [Brassica oleracea]
MWESCRLAPIGFSTHCFTVLLNRATGSLYVIKDLTFLRFSRRAIGEEFGGSLWSEELPLLGGSVGVVTHPSAAVRNLPGASYSGNDVNIPGIRGNEENLT